MLPQETHHHLLVRIHFETRTRRKDCTTRTHGSMAHVSALGLVLLMYCSMLQKMGVEANARANSRRSSEHDHMHAWYIRSKIFTDDEKAMLIPTQVSRYIRVG